MKTIICSIVIISVIAAWSCAAKGIKQAASTVSFHDRAMGIGSENGVPKDTIYFDNLVISEYERGTYTVNDFYQMARRYVDTAKADKQIADVTFLGREPGDYLPEANWVTSMDEYKLISFGFTTDSADSAEREAKLQSIFFEINDSSSLYWSFDAEDKKTIDSLLHAKTKFPK